MSFLIQHPPQRGPHLQTRLSSPALVSFSLTLAFPGENPVCLQPFHTNPLAFCLLTWCMNQGPLPSTTTTAHHQLKDPYLKQDFQYPKCLRCVWCLSRCCSIHTAKLKSQTWLFQSLAPQKTKPKESRRCFPFALLRCYMQQGANFLFS